MISKGRQPGFRPHGNLWSDVDHDFSILMGKRNFHLYCHPHFCGTLSAKWSLGHSFLDGQNSKHPEQVSMNAWDLGQCQILRCKENSHGFLLQPSLSSFAFECWSILLWPWQSSSYRERACGTYRLCSLSNSNKNFSFHANSLYISHEEHYSPIGLMDLSFSLKAVW